jgi:hypothetical protein
MGRPSSSPWKLPPTPTPPLEEEGLQARDAHAVVRKPRVGGGWPGYVGSPHPLPTSPVEGEVPFRVR